MLGIIHLLRAKRWVQNPPSAKRVKLVFAVIAAALVVVGLEWLGLWPDWAQAERIPRGIVR
jgi:predicted acyltransferase